MKKKLLFLLLLFFVFTPNVKAWVGNYTYNITSLKYENSNITFTGWAVIKGNGGVGVEIHNINPSFKLNIGYYTDEAKTYIAQDLAGNSITGNEYRVVGNQAGYSLSTAYQASTSYSKGTNCVGNYDCYYTNSYFSFSIPISDINAKLAASTKSPVYIFFDMTVIINAGEKYEGRTSEAATRTFPITFHDYTKPNNFEQSGFKYDFSTSDKVIIISQNSKVQSTSILKSGNYPCTRCNGDSIGWVTNGVYKVNNHFSNGGYVSYKLSVDTNRTAKNYTSNGAYCVLGNPSNVGGCYAPGDTIGEYYAPDFWTAPSSSNGSYLKTTCTEESNTYKHIIIDGDTNGGDDGNSNSGDINGDTEETYHYDAKSSTSGTANIGDEDVIDNGYCRVTCNETLKTSYLPYQTAKAGTSFKYPISIDGTRNCSFNFYSLDKLLTQLDYASIAYKQTTIKKCPASDNSSENYYWSATYNELLSRFNKCVSLKSQFMAGGSSAYDINPSVDAIIQKANGGLETKKYIRTSVTGPTDTSTETYVNLKSSAKYSKVNICLNKACTQTVLLSDIYEKVLSNWTVKSVAGNVFDFKDDYCVEKYTGKLLKNTTKNCYPVGRGYFTDLDAKTGTYDLTIKITDIGRNVGAWDKRKNAIIDSKYTITKGILTSCDPTVDPKCCVGTGCDGGPGGPSGINVVYRQVALNDLFPTSTKKYGDNWKTPYALTLVSKIQTTGNKVYQQKPKYTFRVTPIQNVLVKGYNKFGHQYGEFNLDSNERSLYISSSGYYTRGD